MRLLATINRLHERLHESYMKSSYFTDAFIKNLKTDKKDYIRELNGFSLQVLPSGVKTFYHIFTFDGKRKYHNLGQYPKASLSEARDKHRESLRLLSLGINPIDYKEPVQESEDLTFGKFAQDYLAWSEEHHCKELFKINELSLKNDVLANWGDIDVNTIRRRDVIQLLENVNKRSSGQVGNVQRAIRGVFSYALEREYLEYNPALNLSKVIPSLRYKPRGRNLNEKEIRHIWPQITPQLKLTLVTAQRPGEVAAIHMREIEVGVGNPKCMECRGCGWLTIPKERAKKNAGDHLVYLTPLAMSLIDESEGYIFKSPLGDDVPIARMALSRYVYAHKYFGIPRWTPHDLRRTARTMMAKIGILEAHAEAVLAHCNRGIIGVYNKYEYKKEKMDALVRWQYELLRIIG